MTAELYILRLTIQKKLGDDNLNKKYLDYKHAWKSHKLSMFSYTFSLFYFAILALGGVLCILYKVALDTSLLSGMVVIMFAVFSLQIFTTQADRQYREEQVKENKQ